MSNRFSVSACGDLIQGIVGIGIFIYLVRPEFQHCMMFLAMLVPAVAVHMAFLMLLSCIVFWLPQAPSLAQSLYNLILLPSTQPISILDGVMRFIYLFIIPALLVGGLPIETLMKPSWKMILMAYVIAAFWLFVSKRIFHFSLRRYESGNSVGIA